MPDQCDELTAYIDDATKPESEGLDPETGRERFHISDINSADWVARKLAAVEEQLDGIRQAAEEQIRLATEWAERSSKGLQGDREHWRALLIEWLRQLREADEKLKTLQLPHATLTSRQQALGIEINNEDAALEWCETNLQDAIEQPAPKIKKSVLKIAVKAGASVPGVCVREPWDKYDVEVTR